jgi:hypothetical protein
VRLLYKGSGSGYALPAALLALSVPLLYLAPHTIETNEYPNLFYNYFTGFASGRGMVVTVNFLLCVTGVLLMSMLSTGQELVEKQNTGPLFVFALLEVTCITAVQISPLLLSNVFLLLSLNYLVGTYRQENALSPVFTAAFWLGVAAYFSIAVINYYPLFFISLLVLRPFNWREWVCGMLGFITPVVIYECFAYLAASNQWYVFEAALQYYGTLKAPSISEYYVAELAVITLLFLIAIANNMMAGFGNTVKKQRSKTLLLWMTALSIPQWFAAGSNTSGILLTCAIPVSILVGDFLAGIRRSKVAVTIIVLMLICAGVVYAGKLGAL